MTITSAITNSDRIRPPKYPPGSKKPKAKDIMRWCKRCNKYTLPGYFNDCGECFKRYEAAK